MGGQILLQQSQRVPLPRGDSRSSRSVHENAQVKAECRLLRQRVASQERALQAVQYELQSLLDAKSGGTNIGEVGLARSQRPTVTVATDESPPTLPTPPHPHGCVDGSQPL